MSWTKQSDFSLNFNTNLAWKTLFHRLDLSGVISPWCPVDGYSSLFVVVGFIVILGKDHNLFQPPIPSLPTSSFLQLHMLLTWTTSPANNRFLPDQYCVKSPGHKCLVLLWSVCGQCLDRPKQKCGELDHGLQFLYVMWCKWNKKTTKHLRENFQDEERKNSSYLPPK